MTNMSYEEHQFFCINCGKRGIPLSRPNGRQRASMHRKKLYCYHCRNTVNHVECRNEVEVAQFIEDFNNGIYIEEAKESLEVCSK